MSRCAPVLFAIAALSAAGCAPRPRAAPSANLVSPSPRLVFGRQVRVRFVGNHALSSEELGAPLQIDKGGSGDESVDDLRAILERDVLLVNAHYFDRGHINVTIDPPEVTEAADGAFVDVTIPIRKEGPRYRIRFLHVIERDGQGREVPAPDGLDLRGRVRIPDGGWFARDVLVKDLEGIRRFYRDRGYADVEADPEIEVIASRPEVDVTIPVRRGPLTRFERVVVDAGEGVSVKDVEALLLVTPGVLFSETKLEESKKRLLARFARVDVSTRPGSREGLIVVTFEVSRAAPPPASAGEPGVDGGH